MLRRSNEQKTTYEPHLKNGLGVVELRHLLSPEEMLNVGRLCAISILPPGTSIGRHTHEGDFELYYFLKGQGRLTLNGQVSQVAAGDATCCYPGDSHSLENTAAENLEYVAIILYAPDRR